MSASEENARPEKTYRIGEVAELLNLRPHVLRFWETEFPQLEPLRTESGQRVYNAAHVEMLRRIQQLLHEQGMTIGGARRILQGEPPEEEAGESQADSGFLHMIESEIADICKLLQQGGKE